MSAGPHRWRSDAARAGARRARAWSRSAFVVLALGLLAGAESASAVPVGTITLFTGGLSVGSSPRGIAAGPDGNVWFTDGRAAIGRITPTGTITEFNGLNSGNSDPERIAAGPDGNLWFTDTDPGGGISAIGRVSPAGQITEFNLPAGDFPTGIAPGPDGNVWFADASGGIGRITPSGTITEFTSGLPAGVDPNEIARGPDGNLWFTNTGAFPVTIGRITPTGMITLFSAGLQPGNSSFPFGIAPGPDGNVWFTDLGSTKAIGRITPSGQITEFSSGLNVDSGPLTIAPGPDGNLWFTDTSSTVGVPGSGAIGRVTPTGEITEFSSGLNAGSIPVGITPGPDGNVWFTDPANGGLGVSAVGRIVAGPPLLFGDPNVESTVDSNPAGTAEAFVTRVGSSGQMSSLHLYVDSSSTASKVVVGIYSDRKGHPGMLRGQATITNVLAGNWNHVKTPSVSVTAGQRVWIAVLGPNGGGTVRFRDATATGPGSETSAQHKLTALRAKWSAGNIYTDGPLSAYGS